MKTTPIYRFYIGVAFSLILAALVLAIALDQRWLGLTLSVGTAGDTEFVAVSAVAPNGPAADVPTFNTRLVALIGADAERFELRPDDLIAEPDVLDSFAAMDAFFERQDKLAALLAFYPLKAELVNSFGATALVDVTPKRQRPLRDLPADFWIQIGVGLTGFWVGLWIWTLRADWATRCLAFAGAALMVSAFAAAPTAHANLRSPAISFPSCPPSTPQARLALASA